MYIQDMKIAQVFILFMSACMGVQAQTTFVVDNVSDFYKAIGSNRTIVLKEGNYHLEKIDPALKNECCNWSMVLFDEIYPDEQNEEDKTLLLSNIQNLTIKAARKVHVQILTNRRAASVVAFKNCSNIKLEGIRFGHDIPKRYTDETDPYVSFCSGEVLEFFDCNKLTIKSSFLFGCGTRGFLAHRCKNISIEESVVLECSYGAFGIFDCENIRFKGGSLIKNTYRWLIEIVNCKNFSVKNTRVFYNKQAEYNEGVVKMEGSENIHLKKFKLKGNDFSNESFYLERENHQP
jgi:hypothetical protein